MLCFFFTPLKMFLSFKCVGFFFFYFFPSFIVLAWFVLVPLFNDICCDFKPSIIFVFKRTIAMNHECMPVFGIGEDHLNWECQFDFLHAFSLGSSFTSFSSLHYSWTYFNYVDTGETMNIDLIFHGRYLLKLSNNFTID